METLGLNTIDWIILIILTSSGLISLVRGFTKEFLSIFLWIFAFIAALSLGSLATPKLMNLLAMKKFQKFLHT